MSDQEYIEWHVDDYLKNRLAGEELKKFNQLLESNESIRTKVEIHKLANELIVNNKLNSIADLSKEVAGEIEQKNRIKKYLISGAVLLILGAAVYLFTKSKVEDSGKVNPIGASEENTLLSRPSESVESSPLPASTSAPEIVTSPSASAKTSPAVESNGLQRKGADEEKDGTSLVIPPTEKEELPVTNLPVQPEKTSASMTVNVCENVNIVAEISTKWNCDRQGNGSILIANIHGGHAPYTSVAVDESGHRHTLNSGLAKGNYVVHLVDSKGCVRDYPHVTVKEINCREDFHFNPFIGELWELPSNGHTADFRVFERSSGLYYEKSFQATEQLQWNGQSNKGDIKEGYFVFEITYSDGSRKNGSITVVK